MIETIELAEGDVRHPGVEEKITRLAEVAHFRVGVVFLPEQHVGPHPDGGQVPLAPGTNELPDKTSKHRSGSQPVFSAKRQGGQGRPAVKIVARGDFTERVKIAGLANGQVVSGEGRYDEGIAVVQFLGITDVDGGTDQQAVPQEEPAPRPAADLAEQVIGCAEVGNGGLLAEVDVAAGVLGGEGAGDEQTGE